MRYRKVKVTHQVVIDDDIDDLELMKELLENICESHIDISLEYLVPNVNSTVLWKKARIISVDEETANINVFFGGCITKNKIVIKNIKFVGIVTDRSGILSGKSNVTTFDFLDLSSDDIKNDK